MQHGIHSSFSRITHWSRGSQLWLMTTPSHGAALDRSSGPSAGLWLHGCATDVDDAGATALLLLKTGLPSSYSCKIRTLCNTCFSMAFIFTLAYSMCIADWLILGYILGLLFVSKAEGISFWFLTWEFTNSIMHNFP